MDVHLPLLETGPNQRWSNIVLQVRHSLGYLFFLVIRKMTRIRHQRVFVSISSETESLSPTKSTIIHLLYRTFLTNSQCLFFDD